MEKQILEYLSCILDEGSIIVKSAADKKKTNILLEKYSIRSAGEEVGDIDLVLFSAQDSNFLPDAHNMRYVYVNLDNNENVAAFEWEKKGFRSLIETAAEALWASEILVPSWKEEHRLLTCLQKKNIELQEAQREGAEHHLRSCQLDSELNALKKRTSKMTSGYKSHIAKLSQWLDELQEASQRHEKKSWMNPEKWRAAFRYARRGIGRNGQKTFRKYDKWIQKTDDVPELLAAQEKPYITVILTYYNQKNILKQQIETWNSYPDAFKQKLHFLFVDDCSKQSAAELIPENDLQISVYRVLEDKYCNIGGARNLGTHVAPTEWILHSDMDHIIPAEAMEQILALPFSSKSVIYKFNRQNIVTGEYKIHPGSMLLTRKLYWEAGGCDEDFVGNYGQTDVHFFYRADKIVRTEQRKDIVFEFYEEGETNGIERSRLEPNQRLFEKKMASDEWSEDFLRFQWEQTFPLIKTE